MSLYEQVSEHTFFNILVLLATVAIGVCAFWLINKLQKNVSTLTQSNMKANLRVDYSIEQLDITKQLHYNGIKDIGEQVWPKLNDELWKNENNYNQLFKSTIDIPTSVVAISKEMSNLHVIGFLLTVVTKADDSDDIEIQGYRLAIHESFRKQGIATALVHKSAALCKQIHPQIKNASLLVRESNQKARKLYKKLGFQTARVIKRKYGNEDGIVMGFKLCDLDLS